MEVAIRRTKVNVICGIPRTVIDGIHVQRVFVLVANIVIGNVVFVGFIGGGQVIQAGDILKLLVREALFHSMHPLRL